MGRTGRGLVAGAVVAAITLGVAGAQTTPAAGLIHACVKSENGQTRIVDAGIACAPSEEAVSWNAQGIQGERGPQGETGPQGPPGPEGPQGPPGRSALDTLLEPYLGSFALYLDGAFAAPLASVDGCTPSAPPIRFRQGDGSVSKLHGRVSHGACVLELGLNMSAALRGLLADTLALEAEPVDALIVRDQAGGPDARLELTNALVSKLTIPELDTTSADPAHLRVELRAERVEQADDASPPLGDMSIDPIEPATLGLAVGTITSAKPRRTERLEFAVELAEFRDGSGGGTTLLPTAVEIPDLHVTYPGTATAAHAALNGWLDGFLAGGASTDQPTTLTAGGGARSLSLALGAAAVYAGDVYYGRRPDGDRRYSLFAETATLSGG